MIVGAGALSRKKLIYVPNIIEKIHITVDRQSIIENLRTKRKAVAPGAITNPIAKIRPAADNIAIIVNERAVNIPK